MAEPQVNAMQLDYSAIVQKPHVSNSRWTPPPHKFFGRKDADGMPTPEPVYVHQDYPAMRYKAVDGKISVVLVDTAAEDELFSADGYKNTPAAFGYVGAPDIQTVLKMRAEAEERASAEQKKTLGLPAKAKVV